jgi:hypothetical protein
MLPALPAACLQLEVLALVCTTLSDARTLCAALCTSSSARQAILAKGSGKLQLQIAPERWIGIYVEEGAYDEEERKAERAASLGKHDAAALARAQAQAAWLARHCMLVGQLQMHLHYRSYGADQTAIQLAVGPLLKLRSLHLIESRNPSELLDQLDPSRLTSLHMQVFYVQDEIWLSPQLAGSIGRLSALQALFMTQSSQPFHDSMGPALAGLQQLTKLVLHPQLPDAALAQLPKQLVELQLADPHCDGPELVAHVKALRQLQSLTLLYSNFITRPEGILEDGLDHPAAWAALPVLKQLDFESVVDVEDNSRLSSALAAGIARATSLTRFYACFIGGCDEGVDIVAMLSPLKQLQSLELDFRNHPGLPTFGQLLSKDLTQLQSLSLAVGPLSQLALFQLCSEARQLTQLVIHGARSYSSIERAGLDVLTYSLTQLRRLALIECGVWWDDIVQVFGSPMQLPHLQQLAYVSDALTPEDYAGLEDEMRQLRPSLHFVACEHRFDLNEEADRTWVDVVGVFAYK